MESHNRRARRGKSQSTLLRAGMRDDANCVQVAQASACVVLIFARAEKHTDSSLCYENPSPETHDNNDWVRRSIVRLREMLAKRPHRRFSMIISLE